MSFIWCFLAIAAVLLILALVVLFGTTQTTVVSLSGPDGGRRFTATSTDATDNEQLSATGSLSLYKVLKGRTLTHAAVQIAAGIGIARIKNTVTQQVKAYMPADIIGEERYRPLDRPVVVEDNDIVEVYCDVA